MFRLKSSHIKKRFPSYTIMDVLMGMVVTSIVVSIVFFLLTSVNKQNHDFQKVRLELNDYLILNNLLKRELDQTAKVLEIPKGLVFQKDNKSIHYVIKEDQLFRADDNSEKMVYPNCSELSNLSTTENNLVTDFDIKVKIQERELVCHYHKDYGQAEIINNELLDGI